MKKTSSKIRRVPLFILLPLLAAAFLLALAETDLSALWNMGCTLAFDTENVALTAEAEFLLDGKTIKKAEGSYDQDGLDSLMRVSVHTPLHDGSVRDTGFTVLGLDGMAYSHDSDMGHYIEWGIDPSRSVIRRPQLKEALQLGGAAAANAAALLQPGLITGEKKEDGSAVYRVILSGEQIPAPLQEALPGLLSTVTWEYGYSYPGMYLDSEWGNEPDILYEDYDALFSALYEKEFGHPLPGDFWDRLTAAEDENDPALREYTAVFGQIEQKEAEAYASGAGYTVFRADGTADTYTDVEDYLHTSGETLLFWDNVDSAFRAYYKKQTGSDISEETELGLYIGTDPVLTGLYAKMYDDYKALAREEPGTLGVHIYADGGYDLLRQHDELRTAQLGLTPVQGLLWLMQEISLSDLDLTVTADPEGRLTGVSGTVSFRVISEGDIGHTFTVKLSCTAGSYGEVSLKGATPGLLGVPGFADWYENLWDGAL